jgi:hypothetical protein
MAVALVNDPAGKRSGMICIAEESLEELDADWMENDDTGETRKIIIDGNQANYISNSR